MKRSNLILQAAIAAALASSSAAYAGNLTGATTFATELFGPTATTALAITPGAVVYTFNTPGGIVINPSGIIYMYERVAGGLFVASPVTGDFAFGGGIAGLTATAAALSTDSTTVRLTITNPTTNNVTIGVGGTITYTPAAGAFNSVNTTLATAGGNVTLQDAVATTSSLPNTGTTLPADLDNGVSNTLNMATSANAITGTNAASSSFPFNAAGVTETARIDLTATSPASRFTTPGGTLSNANSTVLVNLGAFRFSNAAGTQATTNGVTDYTIAGRETAATLAATVTGSFKTGATMNITDDVSCAAGTVLAVGTLNAGLTVFTFTGGTLPTTATNYYACMTVPANTTAIPVTQPALAVTLGTPTVATDVTRTTSGTLYNLQLNGAQVDVRSYVPVGNTGYTSWIRVINTGSVAAPITGQFLYEGGSIGTAGTLITSLAAGGSSSMTANQVETAIGAPTGAPSARPRLRVTAPTNGMNVQSFISNPQGIITDMTGAQ